MCSISAYNIYNIYRPRFGTWSYPKQEAVMETSTKAAQVAVLQKNNKKLMDREQVYLSKLRLDHIVIDHAPSFSPLWTSCYGDEDLASCRIWHAHQIYGLPVLALTQVGQIKKLAVMAHPTLLGRQVMQRYASYTCVRWLRKLEEGKWFLKMFPSIVLQPYASLNNSIVALSSPIGLFQSGGALGRRCSGKRAVAGWQGTI